MERLVPVPYTLGTPTIQFAERGEKEDEELRSTSVELLTAFHVA